MKPYSVKAIINEETEMVEEVRCLDCAAAAGGCKHAMAFLMWLHRRSEEPAPTTIVCYWKKSVLSQVGSTVKLIKSENIGKALKKTPISSVNTDGFLNEVVEMTAAQKNYVCPLLLHNSPVSDSKKLSVHHLLEHFIKSGLNQTADDFIDFCKTTVTQGEIENASKLSHTQSEDSFWFELRYGRLTASKVYEAAACKTANGTLVAQIMGVSKKFDTPAMKRGRNLEKNVISELEKKLNIKVKQVGLIILKDYGVIGASPDGVTQDSVIEIKCPVSEKSFSRYINYKNEIAKKYLAQINLQMLAKGVKKGIFCIAHPDFETTKKITVVDVNYDAEFTELLINSAIQFWKNNIFKLLYTVFIE